MTQTSKAFPYSSFIPYYTNGLLISNDATTPNSILDIATGTTLDSTGTFQIGLTSATTVNSAVSGLGGLDTGSIAASTLYYVYLVADPVTNQASGCMISTSSSAPTLPFGYSAYKLIGFVATDGSSHFLKFLSTDDNSGWRLYLYDAPQATSVTTGNATSYTAVDLSNFVPALANTPVWISTAYTPASAGNTLKLQPVTATGDAVTVTGQVSAVVVTSQSYLFSNLSSSLPKINYKVSNGSDAVAINVAGFNFRL